MWDPQWDPRLRSLIHDAFQRQADFSVTIAFERADCTTLEAAKRLSSSSACLDVQLHSSSSIARQKGVNNASGKRAQMSLKARCCDTAFTYHYT
jgi:hypothetical protein